MHPHKALHHTCPACLPAELNHRAAEPLPLSPHPAFLTHPPTHQPHKQVSNAIAEQRARPLIPDAEAAATLPGGTFAGYEAYASLMRRCWAEEPQERPTFEEVAAELRRIAATVPEPERQEDA